MDQNFHYNVVPNPGRPTVSTRIVFQDDLTTAEIAAAAAAATGLTPAQVAAVLTSACTQIIVAARAGRPTRRLADLITFRPSCGGTHAGPEFQPTADNMKLALNGTLAPDGDALLADGISFFRDAVLGEKTPQVTRVFNASTRELDKCFSGGSFRISGNGFGPEPPLGSATLGVFLRPIAGGGPALQVQGFSGWTDTEITGSWPPGITGDSELILTTKYAGNIAPSTFTYGTILVLIP